jgi:hypothetical protein
MRKGHKIWLVAVAAAALVIGVAVAAAASIPDAGGVIHGCRKNSDGQLRVIDSDAGQMCQNGWTALNWSQTGPQGPAGSPGLAGVHVITDHAAGATTVNSRCPAGETALGVTFTISGGGASPFSATPVFAVNGVTPIGYDVVTSTVSDVHLTCATAA